MSGYSSNIEDLTLKNTNFRQVLFTGNHTQLVLMTLNPGEDIGFEIHEDTDQFFRIEEGEGKAIINDTEYNLHDGVVVIVPAGSNHNIINTSNDKSLKLYTLYSPPHHPDKTIHATKEEALKNEDH